MNNRNILSGRKNKHTAKGAVRIVAFIAVLALLVGGLPAGCLNLTGGFPGINEVRTEAAEQERRVISLTPVTLFEDQWDFTPNNFYCDLGVGPDLLSVYFYDVDMQETKDMLSVEDDFGFRAIFPWTDWMAANFVVMLIPYGTPHTLDGFENSSPRSFIEKIKSETWGDYRPEGRSNSLYSHVEIPGARFEWNAWRQSFDEYPYDDQPYANAYPSGLYSPVVIYFRDDYILQEYNDPNHSRPRGELMFTNKFIRIDNPYDGGYISDEYYGYEDLTEYTELDVNVFVDGGELSSNEVNVTVFDAFGTHGECYGTAPCKVPVGSAVRLKIEPVNSAYDLRYRYSFPIESNQLYEYEVPMGGQLDIYIDDPDMSCEIAGRVTAPVNAGNGQTETKGIGGIAVTVSQNFNGSSESFVTYTNAYGEYRLSVFEDIPAKLIIEDKYYERFTKEFAADEMIWGTVYADAELSAKAPDASVHTEGAVKIPVTCEDGKSVTAYAVLFDSEGSSVASGAVNIDRTLGDMSSEYASGTITLEAPEGEYTLALFDNSGYVGDYIYTPADLELMLKPDSVVRLELNPSNGNDIKSGVITSLDPVTVPALEPGSYALSPISENSYITAPATYTGKGEMINVSAHIGCDSSNAVISAVNITAESSQSTGSYMIAGATFVPDSLVINGVVSDAEVLTESHVETKLIPSVKASGNTDLSFKLETTSASDIRLKICVDAVINGQAYENLEIGTRVIKGCPLTISAPQTTASGNILVTGTSNETDTTVTVYDNGSFVGEAQVDKYGSWQMYLRLPCTDRKAMHSLVAKCNGNVSDSVNVMCDASASVLRGIYILENDAILPNTYVWTGYSSLSFLAVYENNANAADISVFVMCSDGTMLELPAKLLDEDSASAYLGSHEYNTTCFVTDKYPFGEQSLVPVKAWAVSGSSEDSAASAAENYTGIISTSQYRDRSAELEALSWVEDGLMTADYPDEVTFPEGQSGLGFISYETEQAELDALEAQGAHHTSIVDDYGSIMYDAYFLMKNGVMIYGYTDYYDSENYGKSFIVTGSMSDGDGLAPEIKAVYNTLAKSTSEYRYVDTAYRRRMQGKFALMQQTDEYYGKTIDKSVSPVIADFASDLINESFRADGIDASVNLPIGDIISIKSIYDSAETLYKSRQITTPAIRELNFYRQLMVGMSRSDAIDKKSYDRIDNYINNAIHSMEAANKIYQDQFLSNVGAAIVCKGTDLGGAWIKAVGAIGGMVGDLMCDDMCVNGEVVLSGAQGDYLEARLYITKAFGISTEQLNELYADYQNDFTFYALRKKIRDEMKANKDGTDYLPIVDPSGYVYEAVASNRIEGATVTLYSEGMELFDAAHYNQSNPLTTGPDGRYAWDVPEGNWFVKAFRDGYEIGTSQNDPAATVSIDGVNYLPVMPPQLDVNIPLMSEGKAHASVYFKDGKWYLEFDKYVQLDTVNAQNLQFINSAYLETYVQAVDSVTGVVTDTGYPVIAGDAVATVAVLTPLDAELSPAHTPVCGGMMLARTFELLFTNGQAEDAELTVEIGTGLLTYNGKPANSVINVNKTLAAPVNNNGESTTSGGNSSTNTPVLPNGDTDFDDENIDGEVVGHEGLPGFVIALIVIAVLGGAGAAVWFFVLKKKKSEK